MDSVKYAQVIENYLPDEMKLTALHSAAKAIEIYRKNDYDTSVYIKVKFDKKYGPHWTCVVGSDYHTFCSFINERYIKFILGGRKITLFQNN